MSLRNTTWLLALLFLVLQAQLWLGRGSIPHVRELQGKLSGIQLSNAKLAAATVQVRLEADDLQAGGALLETLARQELGMIKNGEVLVRYK